jgi:hypothetical protein
VKNNLLRLLALATALLAANSARASIVTYQFTGTVTTYSPTTPGLPASILGDTATGTFSYNNAAPGGPFYHNASDLQMSMTVTINNTYTFSLTTLGTNGDEIDLDQFIGISFGYYKRGPDELVTGAPNTHVSFLYAQGFEATSTNLGQTDVLLQPGAFIGISDAFSTDPYYFIAITPTSLQQVTAPVVPEPGSIILCATGVVTVAGYGWRRRRKVA